MRHAAIAVLVVLATAAPARAQVQPISVQDVSSYALKAGPLAVHGYQMTLDVSDDSVLITFERTAPGTRQTHTYQFDHIHLTAPRNLRTARLSGRLGNFGSIDLRFRRTGAIHTRKPAPQCSGPRDRHRRGRLTGTFRLVADTTFFGTVTASRLPADLTRQSGSVCSSTGAAPEFPGPLTLDAGDGTITTVLMIAGKDGRSSQDVSVNTQHPDVQHEIESTGPAGSFTGSTAGVTIQAAPGFSGTLSYTPAKRSNKFVTKGTVSGDYTALFDSIAPLTITGAASVTGPS
jgi:hypothetical protein